MGIILGFFVDYLGIMGIPVGAKDHLLGFALLESHGSPVESNNHPIIPILPYFFVTSYSQINHGRFKLLGMIIFRITYPFAGSHVCQKPTVVFHGFEDDVD